jgi:hypothetical protein
MVMKKLCKGMPVQVNQHYQQISCLVLFMLAGASASAVEIELKSTVSCDHQFVTLGDVAVITGCDATTQGHLESLPLIPGPTVGRIRVLRVREIQELLVLRGQDVEQLEWRGSSRVELRGEVTDLALLAAGRVVGDSMTSDRQRKLVADFLAESAAGGSNN